MWHSSHQCLYCIFSIDSYIMSDSPLPQSYQALFRINFATATHQTMTYDGVSEQKMNRAMCICEIAFDAFFDDTKDLVATGVKKDIKCRIAAADSEEDGDKAVQDGNRRRKALKSWLKLDRPLSYGRGEGHETFDLLVRAIAEDDRAIYRGLPGWENNSKTHADFAQALIEMSRPSSPTKPEAPVFKDGSFLPVLKVAHESILEIAYMDSLKCQQDFLNTAIRTALRVFDIKFFPAHKANLGSRGAPNRVPLYNCWGNLGLRPSDDIISINTDFASRPPSIEPETVVFNNAVASDCNAPWEAEERTIAALKECLNRINLPKDILLPSKANVRYVDDTYEWAMKAYRGTKKIHHLALLVAIIASNLLPRLFPPGNSRVLLKDATTKEKVREVYSELDWCDRNKKGMRKRGFFICMITSFIMALYEENNPLKDYLTKNGGGLGIPWTNKNSKR